METEWEHVVLLSADALRADHLSMSGYHRDTSPRLAALATDSLQFTNAYSVSSHTREAVPGLLTGDYPDVAVDDGYHLAIESIATRVAEAGFATGGFHSNPFVSRAYGFDQGFDAFDDDLHFGKHKLVALAQRALDKLRNRHYARAEEINERALSWLDSLDDGESFFLWNHYMDTHGPYEPPSGVATRYTEERISDRVAQSLYQRAIDDPDSITDDERQLLIDLYDAEIRYNDQQIGAFLDALRERNLLEETLLIVTADHGDAFGEHGYFEHPRYLHEELLRVPLLVRPPGGAGETIESPVSTLDVAPTVDTVDRDYPGRSLLGDHPEDRAVFQQARGEDADSSLRRFAIRTREGRCRCEYDHEQETTAFGDCTDRPLRTRLQSHVNERLRRAPGEQTDTDGAVDEEIERRLDALGYK